MSGTAGKGTDYKGTYHISNQEVVRSKRRIIYVREGTWNSLLSDTYSVGLLILVTTLNYKVWHGGWIIDATTIFLWFLFISAKGKAKTTEFKTREDVIKHLQKELKEEAKK